MSGSVNNNNSGYGVRTTGVALSLVDLGFWFRWGPNSFTSGPRYQYALELGIPGVYYEFQVYSDNNGAGTIAFYGDTDGETVIFSGANSDWNYFRFVKDGTDVRLYVSPQGTDTFTLVLQYVGPPDDIDRIEIFQTGANDGLCVEGTLRSMRGYSSLSSEAKWVAEKNSRVPIDTVDMVFNYADYEDPDAATWGVAASGLDLTQFGTVLYSPLDPIPDTVTNNTLFFAMCA